MVKTKKYKPASQLCYEMNLINENYNNGYEKGVKDTKGKKINQILKIANEFIPEKIWVQFANKIEKLYD